MVSSKGQAGMALLLALAVFGAGCFSSGSEDDPLVNPNLEAVLTTGQDIDTTSRVGSSGPGALTISPTAVRIGVNVSMWFTAAGGEPPYTFTLVSNPPNGMVTSAGYYTAGGQAGTDRVRVTDNTGTYYDADVSIYNPATDPNPYRIVCTDLTPPASAVVVPRGGTVNFRIENGTFPDSFNVSNASGGQPMGFLPASRVGAWQAGSTGNNNGSVVDTLQVFDSSSPLNVAVLKIYVCETALTIQPAWAVVPTSQTQDFIATSAGVPPLTWTLSQNTSGAPAPTVLSANSARYTPGSNTQGTYGAADVVQVQDSFPQPAQGGIPHQVAQAKVTVPGLSVFPREAHLRPTSNIVLYALGGSGSYTWSLYQNRSGSGSTSGSGASFSFTSGGGEGLDIVQLTDGTTGGQIRIPVTVCNVVNTRSLQLVSNYHPATGTIGDFTPYDMVVDDFDKDGAPDVALTFNSSTNTTYSNKAGNQVAVLMGAGSGNFAASSTKYTVGNASGPWGIAAGDFNADGNRDLAVALYAAGYVQIMYGDGSGGFPNTGTGNLNWSNLTLPNGMAPTGLQAYNLDRASGDDLIVADGVAGQVAVFLSQGGGPGAAPRGFTQVALLQVSDPNTGDSVVPMCMGVAVANFNNDTNGTTGRTGNDLDGIGWVDIAVTDYAHDRVVVIPATGIASWDDNSQVAFPVWSGGGAVSVRKPINLSVGYFGGTGDTSPDIVVANNGLRDSTGYFGVSVFNNAGGVGTLSFASAVEYGDNNYYTCYFWDVKAYDVDNDGWDDILATSRSIRPDLGLGNATAYGYYGGLVAWRGLGNGAFYGFQYNSAYGYTYYPDYRFFLATAVDVIDFGGQTHGTPGAPLPDVIMANSCYFTGYAHYGKLTIYENRCN